MRISRIVVRNYRTFSHLDIELKDIVTCVIGENNSGKSNLLQAIRLCLDGGLPSNLRSLLREDVHVSVDLSKPDQVLVGIELVDYAGKENEEALVATWQMEKNKARIFYRFRPKPDVREALRVGDTKPGELTLEDYRWELRGGGDPKFDLAEVKWNDDIGENVRFSDLQSYLVVPMPALRDVEGDFRYARTSPLAKLVEASEIPAPEQEKLVDLLKKANADIEASPTIDAIAKAIDKSFKNVAGPAFSMDVDLGLTEANFQSIVRALKLLLSTVAVKRFEPFRNGLGLNNILYIATLIEYFQKRFAQGNSAGQLLLIEEPESHLHPQLQIALFAALKAIPFQSIVTSHSTHITSQAALSTYVCLTMTKTGQVVAGVPANVKHLSKPEIDDLERYLDATKSNLLFARGVLLVEGPAEVFLISALARIILGIDLERSGVSVVAIYGIHFSAFTKLFCEGSLDKKCAVAADADLSAGDAERLKELGEEPEKLELKKLEGKYVRVFVGATTFERELTEMTTLPMLIAAAKEIGAKKSAVKLEAGFSELKSGKLKPADATKKLGELKDIVLAVALGYGKARFAQVAARHASKAHAMPNYIVDAIKWLLA